MSESDFKNFHLDGLEKLGNLILEELKLIRNDMKAEVRSLGKEIKLLYVAEHEKNSDSLNSSFKFTNSGVCTIDNFNNTSFSKYQNQSEEFSHSEQVMPSNHVQASLKPKSFNKSNKHSLIDIVDMLKNKNIAVKQEVPIINDDEFTSFEVNSCMTNDCATIVNTNEKNLQRINNAESETLNCVKVECINAKNEEKTDKSLTKKNDFISCDVKPSISHIKVTNDLTTDGISNSKVQYPKEEKIDEVSSLFNISNQQEETFLVSKGSLQGDSSNNSEKQDNGSIDVCDQESDIIDQNEVSTELVQLCQSMANFKCQYCMKPFRHYSSYQSHLRTHTGEKPFVCSLCNKTFSQKGNLKTHMLFHTNEKPFVCELCNKRFVQKSSLKNHLRIHTGEKPFACNFCSKRFAHRGNLHQHERLHKNIKPHVCEYCDKRFLQRSSLTTHLRSHTGEKPFSCPICGKRFARKSYLKQHMMLHNEDNRFTCQKCDKTFSQRRNYEAHMVRHNKNQIYQCEICRKTFKKAISLMAHKQIHDM